MKEYEIQDLAYALAKSYDEAHTRGEAIKKVESICPGADINILQQMWQAIDAYVDLYRN